MNYVANTPGMMAWINSVAPALAAKLDTSVASATFAPQADPVFTGGLALPGGGINKRAPVNGFVTIDGTTFTGTAGDKVGYAFSARIQGGFTTETGGTAGFVWGANDFIVTGPTAGDVAGLNNLTARETEMHLYTPGASVTSMTGLQVDCKIEASAVGATVTTMKGLYISSVSKDAGTVTTAYGMYIEAPTAGATNYAVLANGAVAIIGPLSASATTLTGNFAQSGGTAKFAGLNSASNAQGCAAGVYLGDFGGGEFGLDIADGTNTWGIDTSAGSLRFMKAGVQQNMALSLAGALTVRGPVGFNNTTPVAKPTVTGAKGSNAALASLLTALAATGILTDSSSA